jgi:hypothetical protein
VCKSNYVLVLSMGCARMRMGGDGKRFDVRRPGILGNRPGGAACCCNYQRALLSAVHVNKHMYTKKCAHTHTHVLLENTRHWCINAHCCPVRAVHAHTLGHVLATHTYACGLIVTAHHHHHHALHKHTHVLTRVHSWWLVI